MQSGGTPSTVTEGSTGEVQVGDHVPSAVQVDASPAKPTSTTSSFRGVSLKSTGRWKAAIKIEGRGYSLGTYDSETAAARAYDVARICALGPAASHLNFPAAQYAAQMQTLSHLSLEVLSKHLRAYGLGTQAGRPTSHYLGVRHHTRAKRWEAIIRMGRRQVSLGLYDSDVAAAEAYDQAAILRHMQGLAAGGLATSLPSLNFNSDHYSCLVDDGEQEQASATSAAGKYVAESACRRPDMLQSRYITAVLDACAEYLKALESENAVGSAEAAGEGPGVREAALAAATMPGDPVRA